VGKKRPVFVVLGKKGGGGRLGSANCRIEGNGESRNRLRLRGKARRPVPD